MPIPNLSHLTAKIDNEGPEVIHNPRELRVNKGRVSLEGVQVNRGRRSSLNMDCRLRLTTEALR